MTDKTEFIGKIHGIIKEAYEKLNHEEFSDLIDELADNLESVDDIVYPDNDDDYDDDDYEEDED